MEIAIDFDGTCVTHEFPNVGQDIGAAPVLRKMVAAGHQLILYTMRSDRSEMGETNRKDIADVTGMFLQDAIDWFTANDIPLYGIQTNPQQGWTTSPKCYAQIYIDDAALGCPLIHGKHERPYVDWGKVSEMLELN